MKKSLEAELISIAHRILQLKNKEDIHELKAITAVLYEKISVLSYAEKHFAGSRPTIGLQQVKEEVTKVEETKEEIVADSTEEVTEKVSHSSGVKHNTEGFVELNTEILKNILAEMPIEKLMAIKEQNARPDGLQYNKEAITEPNTEKIKDLVAQMLPESEKVDEELEKIIPQDNTSSKEQHFGVHYDDLPQFEPVQTNEIPETPQVEEIKEEVKPEAPKDTEPSSKQDLFHEHKTPEFEPKETSTRNDVGGERKSLNDRLKKGINIGLNDRLAYIKHLFEGNAADYNRVLSQLNTINTYAEAHQFIQQQIKPDYGNWENKEVYENRFLKAIENKYD